MHIYMYVHRYRMSNIFRAFLAFPASRYFQLFTNFILIMPTKIVLAKKNIDDKFCWCKIFIEMLRA